MPLYAVCADDRSVPILCAGSPVAVGIPYPVTISQAESPRKDTKDECSKWPDDLPSGWNHLGYERTFEHRDRLLPHMSGRLARPRGAGQDHRT